MKARDVMSSNVISIASDALVSEAAKILMTHRISAAPVFGERGDLVGIVSEGDLMRSAEEPKPRRSWWLKLVAQEETFDPGRKEHTSKRVADVMTRQVVTVTLETPITEIAALLNKHSIKRVPIVADGRVVGIVSRADLVKALEKVPSGVVWG
jgi:CBS domain-containing protein